MAMFDSKDVEHRPLPHLKLQAACQAFDHESNWVPCELLEEAGAPYF